MHLNTIFYGPPGTGKTYHSVLRAAEIISGKQIKDYAEAKALFQAAKGDQIEFITFHQNYSYEDFIQGLKPDTDPLTSGLKFHKRDGIFKQIADRALINLKASAAEQVTLEPSFEEVFDDFFRTLMEENGKITVPMETKSYSFVIDSFNPEQNNFGFLKQSGQRGHTLYAPTLKLFYNQPDHDHIQGLKYYYRPLAKMMLQHAQQMTKTVQGQTRKNFVIIIDEINRANMSRVFGELITLLEEDKRWGNTHQMDIRLPSGDVFAVPKNLYLIGTMNTADKSIALLDIALRRRFHFEPMYPQLTIDGLQYSNVLDVLNQEILQRKGADFLIGHAYFMHDTNMVLSLTDILNTRVIPLLQEYFYNAKPEMIREMLQKALKSFPSYEVVLNQYQQYQISETDATT